MTPATYDIIPELRPASLADVPQKELSHRSVKLYMKRASCRFPDYAMLTEVFNFLLPELGCPLDEAEEDLKEGINRLCRSRCIRWHMTVNGRRMFEINQPKQHK